MLRSDLMSFCDMYLQPEAAFEVLSELGEMGCVQFIDMNPEVQAFQRNYISEVCRCAEMERKLRYMEDEMIKDRIYVPELTKDPKAMQINEMVMYENVLEKWEDDITEMSENQTRLMKNYLELTEMNYLLTHIGPILGDAEIRRESIFANYRKDGARDIGLGGRLVVMTGVVRRSKSFPFEMMLWRISRGNIYYRQASEDKILEDPYTGQEIRKVAFLAVCQGEQLTTRMEKVFTGFRVNSYPCPKTYSERTEMMEKLYMRLSDLEQVLKKTKYHRCKALRTVGRQWRMWMVQIKKAKAIYHTMNLFSLDITKRCLIGQCWVPDRDLQRVQETLGYCSGVIGTNVPSFMSRTTTVLVPPTFHRTNKFTQGFQALIDAYGDSTYRELNPALYSVITFPFLFGMMFGDMGHSLVLLTFALWMVLRENKLKEQISTNEIWDIFFAGRYVILLLGCFSFFTGFVYNDCFGRCLCLMDSYWLNSITEENLLKEHIIEIQPSGPMKRPYIFGIDPVWLLATNKIMFENSLKMKLSIIIGIIHMLFGITLSLFNYIHFKRYYSIYLEFIPEIVFLTCFLFWLVIMMYFKWFKYSAKASLKESPGCAPQILVLFIDMCLWVMSKPVSDGCDAYMFKGQHTVQWILLVIAMLCVPVLLFGTPIYIHFYNKKKREEVMKKISNFRRYQHRDSDKKMEELVMSEAAIYMSSFTELMIYQGVHVIEYVLSTLSHTASYLRLWALSLAHAELSEMLWRMILSKLALRDHSLFGAIKVFFMFALWSTFTVSILVVMEGLSAFLHTLRLHWVEFMSKFYMAAGYPFRPFHFASMLSADTDTTDSACIKKPKQEAEH